MEPLKPLLGDVDRLHLLLLISNDVSLGMSFADDVLHVGWVECVEDVEEVGSAGEVVLWHGVREVLHEGLVRAQVRHESLYRDLLIPWHVDLLHLVYLEELLLAS